MIRNGSHDTLSHNLYLKMLNHSGLACRLIRVSALPCKSETPLDHMDISLFKALAVADQYVSACIWLCFIWRESIPESLPLFGDYAEQLQPFYLRSLPGGEGYQWLLVLMALCYLQYQMQ